MELTLNENEKETIKHKMVTSKGDSGAPLIVQPKGMIGLGFAIGLHCAGKYDSCGYKF